MSLGIVRRACSVLLGLYAISIDLQFLYPSAVQELVAEWSSTGFQPDELEDLQVCPVTGIYSSLSGGGVVCLVLHALSHGNSMRTDFQRHFSSTSLQQFSMARCFPF